MKQIDDKGYLIPYQRDGREVVKVGVEFSAEERNIARWLCENDKLRLPGYLFR